MTDQGPDTPLPKRPLSDAVETNFRIIAATFFLFAAIIVGLQILGYLTSGHWIPFSVIELARLFSDNEWLLTPVTWIVVHKTFSAIPASALFLAAGFIIAVTG